MRKIIITHNKMPGEIELRYNEAGMLNGLVVRGEPRNSTISWVLQCIPMPPDDFAIYKTNGFIITELEEPITFDMFWTEYGRKINKERCIRLWDNLKETERIKAFNGIAQYGRHLSQNAWKSKADPENYLKKKYWDNEWQ